MGTSGQFLCCTTEEYYICSLIPCQINVIPDRNHNFTYLRGIQWVWHLCRNIQIEAFHYVHFLVSNFHLKCTTRLDEILFQNIVKGWVKFFTHILN